jgi:transposase
MSGMCALYPYDGPIDGERFLDFLDFHLLPNLRPGDVLVMDNLRVHHIKEVKERADKAEIKLLYLPPYSPELNPIEEAWSIIKRIFRSMEAKTISAFVSALNCARAAITPSKIQNLFRHAGYGLV